MLYYLIGCLTCSASGQSLYKILGLEKNCTPEDIKRAYRKVVSF